MVTLVLQNPFRVQINELLILLIILQNPATGRFPGFFVQTRTKTSIRYAKENDREKRERKKGGRRDLEREGEIREIERERERERER